MKEIYTVLLVDDQKENLDILVDSLEDDYELLVATTGERAIDILERSRVDLILLDVFLPKQNGYEVCQQIKAEEVYKEIPVIFISAQDDLAHKKKGFSVGAVDYITKPVSVDELKARVHTHLLQSTHKKKVIEENSQLINEVTKKQFQLENVYNQLEFVYLETIERLSRAAEFRDDETGMHVKRVGRISAIVAEKLGLGQAVVDAIEHAAPLHDIGKIGIPESVLLKPGTLDEQEWKLMKNHCEIGKDILSNSGSTIINMAELIALTHHERWDGNGYPLGLKEEQIPIVSRIVAIADVYDALLSKRSYKEPYSPREALRVIMTEERMRFDPKVVEAFLSSLDEIEAISVQ